MNTNNKPKIELIIVEEKPVTYVNLTGATIQHILENLNLSNIVTTYMDCRFSKPKECQKWVYPVSERIQCISQHKVAVVSLDLLQYNPDYHIKLEGYMIKFYDYNVGSGEKIFQLLLNDDEYIKLHLPLKRISNCIWNNCGL